MHVTDRVGSRRIYLLLFAIFVLFSGARADSVDDLINEWMNRRRIPGAAVVVIKDGMIVKKGNYGLSNVELQTMVNERTSFEIASMTKQFTAAAVLLLVEEGKLDLEDSVSKHFDGLPSSWSNITIRQLLNHTSGLRDDWDENDDYFITHNSDESFLMALTKQPLKFPPGERYAYSCGPFVAGMVIKKISGMSYSEFMRKKIFEPLGMSSTHVNDVHRLVPERAAGYLLRDGKLENGVRLSPAAHARGDVGIRTTASDLAIWSTALDQGRLLRKASLREMFSNTKLQNGTSIPSGLGWWLNPIRGYPVQHHGGAFRTGFNSTINRYPSLGITVIVLTNRFRVGANDMGHIIAGAFRPELRSLSYRDVTVDPDPARTRAFLATLHALLDGKENLPGLAASFPYRYFEKTDWQQAVEGAKGLEYLGCENITDRDPALFGSPPSKICFFRVIGEPARYVSFVSDLDGKIVYIDPYEY